MNSTNISAETEKSLTILSQQKILEKDFTVYGTAEEPLFLAKDVAEMIDYSKSDGKFKISQMISTVDEDEKVLRFVDTTLLSDTKNVDTTYSRGNNFPTTSRARKTQEMWFLTENGLYEVLMQSRKPIAKSFKKQVKKILHDLRTGKTVIAETKTIDEFAHIEARVEAAKMLREIGLEYSGKSQNYKQILDAYTTKALTGTFVLPLPEVTRQSYSATEIGQMMGISANKVGSIAIKYGLKTDEFGLWVHDKSKYSAKEIDTFRYYDSVIPEIKKNLLDITPKKIESAAENWIEKEGK